MANIANNTTRPLRISRAALSQTRSSPVYGSYVSAV